MKTRRHPLFVLVLIACLGVGFAASLFASEPSISPAPTAPHTVEVVSAIPAAPATPARLLTEADLLQLVTTTLQQDYVKDKGELELRLPNPWPPRKVPDEPLTVKILDLPSAGVATSFIMRIELRTARESLGTWQLAAQAHVWREVWVAGAALKRGEFVAEANIVRERRDILALREALADFPPNDTTLMMAEPLQTGSPLLARSVKARPVVHRGQTADALVRDGMLSVTLKVELLEDGVPGQIVRARNHQSRRDLRGKVLNEQTILISL